MKQLSRLFAQARKHHLEGRPEQAEQLCQQVVAADPRHGEAWHLLGVLAGQAGRNDRAVELFERAVTASPSHALARANLAVALRELGRRDDALAHLRTALELAPDSLHAVRNSAALLAELERWPEAAPMFERWAALEPGNATIHQMLGDCYALQGLGARAAACYIKSLELNPDAIDVANKLGAWLVEENFRAPVLAFLCQVVERNPESAPAWANLGSVTKNLGDLNTALRCYDRALALQPSHANILWNRALCLLALGRLPEGWADYEYRWKSGALRQERPFTQPRWDGGDLAGKTILVWLEQGLGDQIAFASMLPDLIRGGAHLVVESDARLVTLLARSLPGVDVVASTETLDPRTQQPDIDFQIPAGSLPRWLRPSLGSFPRHRGYLVPDAGKADAWSKRLAALGDGLKVGICWRSMVTQGVRSQHYAQLSQWGPILTTAGASLVNLQYDRCDEELREAERLFGIRIHGWDDINLRFDQEGVAALISSLDLVISTGTAVDQMAGALGTPTWVLMRGSSDWWGLGTDYCPWYPSVRTFRCGASEPWEPMIETLASELEKMAAGSPREEPQIVESA